MTGVINASKINIEKTEFLRNNLDTLIMQTLYMRPMSKHDLVGEIFRKHGMVMNPSRFEETLSALERDGILKKEKSGLATLYSLTEKGEAASLRTRQQ